jgi:hypothetical protein
MSFLLRNARHEKLFDVRKCLGHPHPKTGEKCDGLCYSHLTMADFEAAAKDEAPALTLTCHDCGASVALTPSELACEMERAAKALLNAADDLFRLAFAYQEGVQTAAAMATIRRAMELNGGHGDDPEREQMMLGYAVRSAVAEVRRQVADLHQRRYSNLG